MIQKNVLVTSAGVATGVNVISALRSSTKYRCCITSADMCEDSAGLYLSDNHYITPSAESLNFFDNLKEIIEKDNIDFIFPLHSSEIEFFAENKKQLNDLDVGVTIPDKSVVNRCNNKDLFELFLQENGFIYPKTYKNKEAIDNYPVFIKQKVGSSSKNAYKVNSEEILEFYINGKEDNYIIQEYQDWREITIDCYVNKNYKLVGYVPRFRLKVKDGKSVVAKTMYDQHVFEQTKNLLENLNFTGACNIQMFYKDGETKIIEINPRLSAGGLPLATRAGVNIPELMMEDYFAKVDDELIEYNKNLTMYRYLTEVFVC